MSSFCSVRPSKSGTVSRPFLQVVASLARARTACAAVVAALRVDQLVDFRVAVVLGGHHRDRQFSLRAVTSLHDLADSQAAVLSRNVRLLAVRRRLDRRECWWRLMLQREMMQSGQLNTVVEVLRAQTR